MAKDTKSTFKPGEKAPVSGQWKVGHTKREVTVSQGETFPPGPKGSHPRYHDPDKTRHKR